MIYIVGYTFQFNTRSHIQSTETPGMSMQERIALTKINQKNQKTLSAFDPRFIAGHTYKIVRIFCDPEGKWHYIFNDLSNSALADIDVSFPDSFAGDNYVAAISCKTKQLEEERNQIEIAYKQNENS
ncbi:MAG: hypothetical protein PHS54_00640 [Clostridia bacterium]|nr:hypothetical protein [Clostridia bacterium]